MDGAFLAFEVLGQRRAYGSVALLSGGSAGEELRGGEGFRPGTVLFDQKEPDFHLEQQVALIQPKVAPFKQGDA